MRRGERRRLLVLCVALLAVIILAVAFLPALYFLGLSFVHEKPTPTAAATEIPEVASDALWAVVGGDGPADMKAMGAWDFVQLRVCRARSSRRATTPEQKAWARENCLREQPGLAGAADLAHIHIVRSGLSVPSARAELAQVATGIWLTRNWTADVMLKELAVQGDYGHGWRGMNVAAIRYFGEPIELLNPADVALLAACLRGLEIAAVDPLCDPASATARRNVILERMQQNGALTQETAAMYVRSPLGVLDRPCRQEPGTKN